MHTPQNLHLKSPMPSEQSVALLQWSHDLIIPDLMCMWHRGTQHWCHRWPNLFQSSHLGALVGGLFKSWLDSNLTCALHNIECSLCGLIRHPKHLIGKHWYLPANWRSFIRWSHDQWVSQCYAIECDRSFYCALFCIFMTHVSQCPSRLSAEQPIYHLQFEV
jgi:hypothetical protein